MSEVCLHVYDVTNSVSVKTNSVIVNLNKLMRDGMGLGGIFHGAIQVYEAEWSFGYCEHGSGVFSCTPKQNAMYTYRETISLGHTTLSEIRVDQILTELSREWPGYSYDVLSRNCNHFCEQFCERLGVQKLPGWLNRFANAGDVAVEVTGNVMERLRQAKSDVVLAGKVAMRYLSSGVSSSPVSANESENGATITNLLSRFPLIRVPWRNISQGSSSSQEAPLRNNSGKEDSSHDANFTSVNMVKEELNKVELWHKRLGHPNFKSMEMLCTKDLVLGLPKTLSKCGKRCEACSLSKAHKLPFVNSSTRSTKTLDLIHSDVQGFFSRI
ncbi:hypothetical protein O6H91_10G047900 [Diphasiastrum complanatum]|uniref:Uncharacterized protein n=1 Tax=Diphasiastrum complanatum TaxID=34168 RepID=A0ACC2CGP7_DIPCM|nr:hypothetical protein O6H91_10G047900 [Diphasiastrum complanatum]